MKLFVVLGLMAVISVLSGAGLDLEKGEFVLGFYSADAATERNFELIRDAGMNYVHTYATGDDTPEAIANGRKFLDLAQKYDLQVMFDIGGRKWVKPEFGTEPMLKMIDNFKNHPALGMWYLCDEPSIDMIPRLEQLHRTMQQATPDIPSSIVIHWIKDWYKARTACDILLVDLYPVREKAFPESPLSNYNTYVQKAIQLKDPAKPVIGVMQSMNWDCFADQLKKGPDVKYSFPNAVEMRNMGFSSVAMGVRGLFFFSFFHIHTEPSTLAYHPVAKENMDWYRGTFMPFIKEVKEFTAMVHPSWQVTAADFALHKEHKAYAGYWERPAGKFLVVTNDTGETRDLKLKLQGKYPRRGKLVPWGNTRPANVELRNGVLTIPAVQPWEIFIWQVQ